MTQRRRNHLQDIENQLERDIENQQDPKVKNALQKYYEFVVMRRELEEILTWCRWW